MKAPDYALLYAYDDGATAARYFLAKRVKWPSAPYPDNPFGLTDNPHRRASWDKGFFDTLKKHGAI